MITKKLYNILFGISASCFGATIGKGVIAYPDHSRMFGNDVRMVLLLGTMSLLLGIVAKLGSPNLEIKFTNKWIVGFVAILMLLTTIWIWLIQGLMLGENANLIK